ncbi:MAG: hemerythrin domain-containing protein [Thermoplasmatales archaeon]|nr:hemerythrin domain-containing protein [Thermoplasmatales archaeon]
MGESISILELMIKDHCKIEELINELEKKSKEDFESMRKAFNNFEWELEKHIFTEEKAIFTSYNPEDVAEGYKMLPELTKQHNFIINTLNNWRDDVRNRRMLRDVYSFKEFIIRHKNFEEEKVYPQLDEALPEDEKRQIVTKINEIVQR